MMWQFYLSWVKSIAFIIFLLYNSKVIALEFLAGAGVGFEYTDNARLTTDNQVEDLIAVGYLGASLVESDGPVNADISASLNHHRYTKNTYEDQRYFNLRAAAGWEMVKERFEWLLQNYYRQRPINSSDPNTPDNIQDENIFTFGADINFPLSGRNIVTVIPEYRNFYYEILATDNQQYSLAANWGYLLNALTSIGLSGSVRTIDYDEPYLYDVTFSSLFFTVSSNRVQSEFTTNLGATSVKRDNGQSTEEFAGNLNWLINMTPRSSFRAFVSTDLTDSSTTSLYAAVDPGTGNPNDVQITTDVIRNKVFSLGYYRSDGSLESSLTGSLREINYSESPDDRRIRTLGANLNYPVTALLTSGVYAQYNHTEYIDAVRTDNNYVIGGGIRYQLSRNLNSSFDIKYRNRDSTLIDADYDEWSAYVSLVYGFGQPLRPTRSGGF